MTKQAALLWLDLEMTGIEVERDVILEAAAIVTDWDFHEIAIIEKIIIQDEKLMRARMKQTKSIRTGKNFWDENPEARDGLLSQNKNGQKIAEVQKELIHFINQNFADSKEVYLAGNSIHNDRRFIAKYMPLLDARLHYRMLDVTAWKLVFENKLKKNFTSPKQHRAVDDIRRSISELEYYLKKVKP